MENIEKEIESSDSYIQIDREVENLEFSLMKIKKLIKDSTCFYVNEIENIKQEVCLGKEKLLEKIDTICNEMIEDLENYQKKCLESILCNSLNYQSQPFDSEIDVKKNKDYSIPPYILLPSELYGSSAENNHNNPTKNESSEENYSNSEHSSLSPSRANSPSSASGTVNKPDTKSCTVTKKLNSKCNKSNSTIKVKLQDINLWKQFSSIGTEMILTKKGRCMFPSLRVNISGLEATSNYSMVIDMLPVDDIRYKYLNGEWMASGKTAPTEGHFAGHWHPDSPQAGLLWMKQSISFHKLKLTNNSLDPEVGHVLLKSMRKYVPRLHIIEVFPGKSISTFTFTDATFISVTAYQNESITKLKIEYNPFAKSFRDSQNRKDYREARYDVKRGYFIDDYDDHDDHDHDHERNCQDEEGYQMVENFSKKYGKHKKITHHENLDEPLLDSIAWNNQDENLNFYKDIGCKSPTFYEDLYTNLSITDENSS